LVNGVGVRGVGYDHGVNSIAGVLNRRDTAKHMLKRMTKQGKGEKNGVVG
jgi:hypothetical protein